MTCVGHVRTRCSLCRAVVYVLGGGSMYYLHVYLRYMGTDWQTYAPCVNYIMLLSLIARPRNRCANYSMRPSWLLGPKTGVVVKMWLKCLFEKSEITGSNPTLDSQVLKNQNVLMPVCAVMSMILCTLFEVIRYSIRIENSSSIRRNNATVCTYSGVLTSVLTLTAREWTSDVRIWRL